MANEFFPAALVRSLIARYQERGCTDVELRDEIMIYMEPLIHGAITVQNLHQIQQWQGGDSLDDLTMMAWIRIEKILYKVDCSLPPKSLFSMISRVAQTTVLAWYKLNWRRTTPKNLQNTGTVLLSRLQNNVNRSHIRTNLLDQLFALADHEDERRCAEALILLMEEDLLNRSTLVLDVMSNAGVSRQVVSAYLLKLKCNYDLFKRSVDDYNISMDDAFRQ